MNARLTLSLLATTAMLATTPAVAQPRDGTPGNPPSTATGRAVDAVQGQPSRPGGTQGNPPGTAAGRALDQATGSNVSGANPPATTGDAAQTTTTTTPTGTVTTTTPSDAARTPAQAPATTAPASAAAPRDGLRASRFIGTNIYNEADETVGEVEELIVSPQGGPPLAVISVGGFLGIGARQVAVPFSELQRHAERDRWVLPGATRDSLKERPAFAYDDRRSGTAASGADAPASRGAAEGGGPRTDRPEPARQ
ncbi:MAG TPA: PRC-barrel domain-containing protein [Falsiroseomonas sp.]|nr:PRC-barrel domain-containing protein [Falsiroseomonas sp.]